MFERLIGLIGKDKFNKLQNIKVLLVGLGGVGGYAFESLVRSGIEQITIADGDVIEESNLNRQIITSNKNIGKSKIEAAKERAIEINPLIKIEAMYLYITKGNIDEVLKNKYDYVIDACDDLKAKLLFIEHAKKYKLISCMGTANKTDPSLLQITSIDKTSNDPIARILRRKIKELNIKTKFKVVSSTESPLKSNMLGTNSFVPGVAGLLCASYVFNDIIKK